MNVVDELRSLTQDSPTGDIETGQVLYRRGRRRLARRRATLAGGGLAVVAMVAALAVSALPPTVPVIEDVMQQPDQASPGDTSEEDAQQEPGETGDPEGDADGNDEGDEPGTDANRPEGSEAGSPTEATIGQVTLTIPAAFTVRATGPDDATPCLRGQAVPTFFLAPDGAPAIPDGQCPQGDPTATSVLATTSATVPPAWLPGEGQEEMTAEWTDIEIDGAPAQRVTDPSMPGLVLIRSVELDLYIEIIDGDLDAGLIDELLASIRQRS